MHLDDEGKDIRQALHQFRQQELKILIKEAIKEWLDEQATMFGKWSLRYIALSALGVLAYFILTTQGVLQR